MGNTRLDETTTANKGGEMSEIGQIIGLCLIIAGYIIFFISI